MALSFEESRKRLLEQQATATRFTLMRSTSTTGEWIPNDKYVWFDDYYDDKISMIDNDRVISIHDSQINISQEINSQFIPFEMMRRYDNIDLVDMAMSIHYTTKDNCHGSSKPVNVQYNDEKIRFAWLVDENATHVAGDLKFEIHFNGAIVDRNGKSYAYRWKSKPAKFTVLESLCEGMDCEPADTSDDWVAEIVESVSASVAENIAEAVVEDIAESELQECVQNTVDDAVSWGAFGR